MQADLPEKEPVHITDSRWVNMPGDGATIGAHQVLIQIWSDGMITLATRVESHHAWGPPVSAVAPYTR